MLGRMMLRGTVRYLRGGKKQREPVPQKSWGEIARMPMGAWAIVIFATLFVSLVIAIGVFIDYTNARY